MPERVITATKPTIAAGAAGGTAPVVSVVAKSTDSFGQVSYVTDADDTTGILATITFNRPFRAAPIAVLLTPLTTDAVASGLFVSSITATTIVVNVRTDPGASKDVSFCYAVHAATADN